ncbi:peptidase domain-containing ABC transporter [Metabacillus arenae]|uniref:Peptidase domain-containing ABC transporter n=1 Tax=Metabacillus arenae TaxID=2771434 RepID=A0A926RZV0_9BACI|nr:peptidase domain-containing ABC transporter [Metabacillus arenae]MBD1383210.1 peptidase domain-containing ABC transporter [Metabacillus arenae]
MTRNRRRIPFIEQMEQSECGLCCLAMILSYYQSEYTLSELRNNWGGGREGINLLIIKKIAESLNLETSAQRVAAEYLDKIELPAVLHWQGDHFVVVEKVRKNKIFILDPAAGRRVIFMEELDDHTQFICLSMKPTENLKRRKVKKVWREYIRFLWEEPQLVMSIIVFSLFVQLLAVATPMLVQFIVDHVIVAENKNLIDLLALPIILLVAIQFVFSLLRTRTVVKLQNRLDLNLMTRFFNRLLKLPFHFFQMRTSGDLILRANSNMIIREILSTRTVTMLLDGGMVLSFLVYMLYSSAYLSLYVIGFAILQVVLTIISNRYISRFSQEEILRQTKASSYLAEVLRGILVVKSEGVEPSVYKQWSGLFLEQIKASRKRGFFTSYVDSTMQTLRIAAPLIILLLGTREVMAETMTLGAMMAFYTLAISFFIPLTSLVTTTNQMVLMGTYFRRILDILETEPEQDDDRVTDPHVLEGRIELKNIDFQYNRYGPVVIKGVSAVIEPGQFVAIVGTTGSGKSTLASLLMGLYQPTNGQVLFDGQDITNMDKSKFRQQIGVVTQQVHLFNSSIYQNIAFHNPEIGVEEVIRAAKLAEIHDDIMLLPMKYQTILSEEGSNLSGGQRQRMALARALAHRPAILLLDEASSSLDTVTEERIHKNLEELNCTRIVIAHRLSTVKNADIILVVNEGEIVETGTHFELLHSGHIYPELHRKQVEKNTEGALT